jgi:hypothetical protein
MSNIPVFRDNPDGTVTLEGEMPHELPVTRELLDERWPHFLFDGKYLNIRCTNGRWLFKVKNWGHSDSEHVVLFEQLYHGEDH